MHSVDELHFLMAAIAVGFVIAVVLIIAMIIIAVLRVQGRRQRTSRLRELTPMAGLQFLATQRGYAALFNDGRQPFRSLTSDATNVLIGQYRTRPVSAFQYNYVTFAGRAAIVHPFRVWSVALPGRVPHFSIGNQEKGRVTSGSNGVVPVDIGEPQSTGRFRSCQRTNLSPDMS